MSNSKPKDFYEVMLCCSPQDARGVFTCSWLTWDWHWDTGPDVYQLDELDFKTLDRVSLRAASCPPHGKHVWCRDRERGNIKRRLHKWEDTSTLLCTFGAEKHVLQKWLTGECHDELAFQALSVHDAARTALCVASVAGNYFL